MSDGPLQSDDEKELEASHGQLREEMKVAGHYRKYDAGKK